MNGGIQGCNWTSIIKPLLLLLVITAPAGWAQETPPGQDVPDEADEVRQKWDSIRITIYSHVLRDVATQGWGLRFRLRATAGVYKFETLDEILGSDSDHLQSIGFRPRLEFEFPTGISDVSFVPNVELAFNRLRDNGRNLLSGSVTAALRYRRSGVDRDLIVEAASKYGTRYDEEGLNLEDFIELSLGADLRRALGLQLGSRRLVMVPFGKYSYFADNLEFQTEQGLLFDVTQRFELGFKFNTQPGWGFAGIRMPDIRISYFLGDGVKGIKIRI